MLTKVKTGATFLLFWQAPEALASGTTPTLTVKLGGVAVAGLDAMQAVAGPATITAVPTGGGKTLTASGEVATSARATVEAGEAFYLSDEDGVRPVRVRAIDGTAITLTEPLVPVVQPGGTLQWARWWTTLTSADVTAAPRRDVTWEVAYRPARAGSAADETATTTDGPYQLVIVDRIFATGLTTARLHGALAELGQSVPARDSDRAGVIALAFDELVTDIRADVRAVGRWEDDLDGAAFRLPHTLLSAAWVIERTDPDRAAQLRARYKSALAQALKVAQLDIDGDGVPDEDPTALRGAPALAPASLSSIIAATPAASRPAYARMRF